MGSVQMKQTSGTVGSLNDADVDGVVVLALCCVDGTEDKGDGDSFFFGAGRGGLLPSNGTNFVLFLRGGIRNFNKN